MAATSMISWPTPCAKVHSANEMAQAAVNDQNSVDVILERDDNCKEKRRALETWSRHLESLIGPVPDNVVALGTARRG